MNPSLQVRLPPISTDPNRCQRALVGNTIGQANAVSDTAIDLRMCDLKNSDLSGKTLSGALMSDADLSGSKMVESVLTKVYAVGANLVSASHRAQSLLQRLSCAAELPWAVRPVRS